MRFSSMEKLVDGEARFPSPNEPATRDLHALLREAKQRASARGLDGMAQTHIVDVSFLLERQYHRAIESLTECEYRLSDDSAAAVNAREAARAKIDLACQGQLCDIVKRIQSSSSYIAARDEVVVVFRSNGHFEDPLELPDENEADRALRRKTRALENHDLFASAFRDRASHAAYATTSKTQRKKLGDLPFGHNVARRDAHLHVSEATFSPAHHAVPVDHDVAAVAAFGLVGSSGLHTAQAVEGCDSQSIMSTVVRAAARAGRSVFAYGNWRSLLARHGPTELAYVLHRTPSSCWSMHDNSQVELPDDAPTRALFVLSLWTPFTTGLPGVTHKSLRDDLAVSDHVETPKQLLERLQIRDRSVEELYLVLIHHITSGAPVDKDRLVRALQTCKRPIPSQLSHIAIGQAVVSESAGQATASTSSDMDQDVQTAAQVGAKAETEEEKSKRRRNKGTYSLQLDPPERALPAEPMQPVKTPHKSTLQRVSARTVLERVDRFEPQDAPVSPETRKLFPGQSAATTSGNDATPDAARQKKEARWKRDDMTAVNIPSLHKSAPADPRPSESKDAMDVDGDGEVKADGGEVDVVHGHLEADLDLFADGQDAPRQADEIDQASDDEQAQREERRQRRRGQLGLFEAGVGGDFTDTSDPAAPAPAANQKQAASSTKKASKPSAPQADSSYKEAAPRDGVENLPHVAYGCTTESLYHSFSAHHSHRMPEVLGTLCALLRSEYGRKLVPALNALIRCMWLMDDEALFDPAKLTRRVVTFLGMLRQLPQGASSNPDAHRVLIDAVLAKAKKNGNASLSETTVEEASLAVLRQVLTSSNAIFTELADTHLIALEMVISNAALTRSPFLIDLPGYGLIHDAFCDAYCSQLQTAHKQSFVAHLKLAVQQRVAEAFDTTLPKRFTPSLTGKDRAAITVEIVLGLLDGDVEAYPREVPAYIRSAPSLLLEELESVHYKGMSAAMRQDLRRSLLTAFGELSQLRDQLLSRPGELDTLRRALLGEKGHANNALRLHNHVKRELLHRRRGVLANVDAAASQEFFSFQPKAHLAILENAETIVRMACAELLDRAPAELPDAIRPHLILRPPSVESDDASTTCSSGVKTDEKAAAEMARQAERHKWSTNQRFRLSRALCDDLGRTKRAIYEATVRNLPKSKSHKRTLNSLTSFGLHLALSDIIMSNKPLSRKSFGTLGILTNGEFTYRRGHDLSRSLMPRRVVQDEHQPKVAETVGDGQAGQAAVQPGQSAQAGPTVGEGQASSSGRMETMREYFVRVVGETKSLFQVQHQHLVVYPSVYGKSGVVSECSGNVVKGNKLRPVPLQPTYRHGAVTPADGDYAAALDRLGGADLLGIQTEHVRYISVERTRHGLPLSVHYINSPERLLSHLAWLQRDVNRGGLGWTKEVALRSLRRIWGVDTGNVEALAMLGIRAVILPHDGPARHRHSVLPAKTVFDPAAADLKKAVIEALVRPGNLQSSKTNHDKVEMPIRSKLETLFSELVATGQALESGLEGVKAGNARLFDEWLLRDASYRSMLARIVHELLDLMGFRTDRRWTAESAGPTETPITVAIGDSRGTSTAGLHTAFFVNSILVALMKLARSLNLPISFVRVSEFMTSQLCPRRACRDDSPERFEPMLCAVWNDEDGQPTKNECYRIKQCVRCRMPYHKDLSAAQLIAYVFEHWTRFHFHPFRDLGPELDELSDEDKEALQEIRDFLGVAAAQASGQP